MRLLRFLLTLRGLMKHRLLSRHNIRAAWIQAENNWQQKLPSLDLSDEEWEEFWKED